MNIYIHIPYMDPMGNGKVLLMPLFGVFFWVLDGTLTFGLLDSQKIDMRLLYERSD